MFFKKNRRNQSLAVQEFSSEISGDNAVLPTHGVGGKQQGEIGFLSDDEFPLMTLGNSTWTLKNAFEGVLALGSTGSGKSSGAARALATACLRSSMGDSFFAQNPVMLMNGDAMQVKQDEKALLSFLMKVKLSGSIF